MTDDSDLMMPGGWLPQGNRVRFNPDSPSVSTLGSGLNRNEGGGSSGTCPPLGWGPGVCAGVDASTRGHTELGRADEIEASLTISQLISAVLQLRLHQASLSFTYSGKSRGCSCKESSVLAG